MLKAASSVADKVVAFGYFLILLMNGRKTGTLAPPKETRKCSLV